MKFIMTIGVAGCGKSTWCEQNAAENDIILSSDALRAELLGDVNDQSQNGMIFEEMKRRTIVGLRGGHNIFYDATNLSFKNRFNTLKEIHKHFPGIETECVVFAIPYEVCLLRNSKRERQVPAEVIKRQISNFQPPLPIEDWDNIKIITLEEIERLNYEHFIKYRMLEYGDQHNPHHQLSLYDHSKKCSSLILPPSTDNFTIAFYHDCGKLYTTQFDSEGVAHFPNHNNVSSFLVLCMGYSILISQVVFLHMFHYDEKAAIAWQERAGEEIWGKVAALGLADEMAH